MDKVLAFRGNRKPAGRTLGDFAETWFDQASVGWRESTTRRVGSILRCHVLPVLAAFPEDGFTRQDLMALRADLARGTGACKVACSPSRVNAIVQVINQMMAERALQLDLPNPCAHVRRIPSRKPGIRPFTLPELRRLAGVAPPHLGNYVWLRGIAGLRSGEANGLKWDCVDLVAGTIEIRRAYSDGADRLPKNQYSERVLKMTPSVQSALQAQHMITGSQDGYVFQTRRGKPLDIQNFARRDWRRILADAGLAYRAPEQLRHTAATLMLAAGEAPTYVAHVLGHSDCRMLLSIYARYMPGALGRSDGSALEAVLLNKEQG